MVVVVAVMEACNTYSYLPHSRNSAASASAIVIDPCCSHYHYACFIVVNLCYYHVFGVQVLSMYCHDEADLYHVKRHISLAVCLCICERGTVLNACRAVLVASQAALCCIVSCAEIWHENFDRFECAT